MQSRAEKIEKVQTKEGTTKETTQKLKGKTHPAKQTETVEIVSAGSMKTYSTGSMETSDTILST